MVNIAGCQVLQVGGTEDHVHVLITLSKTENTAHVVEEMKRNSSRWIKTLSPYYVDFAWQGGYGAFSIGQSQVNTVIRYLLNQAEHHKKQTFREEYLQFLQLYNIEYDEKYLWTD
jgi:REP element-mobilizing transposase RayT